MLSNDNFEEYAANYYDNSCIDVDEFIEDIGRIKYIKRLINKFKQTGEIKERLIINHLIVLYNVFESRPLTKMLFFKLEGLHSYLKPFLILIQRLPDSIPDYTEQDPVLYTSNIISDPVIVHELRKLSKND